MNKVIKILGILVDVVLIASAADDLKNKFKKRRGNNSNDQEGGIIQA